MLLLIGNNKKPILNNKVPIYIPNRKNSKRKWRDFLFFFIPKTKMVKEHSHDRYKMFHK